jgi:hypothetical protein
MHFAIFVVTDVLDCVASWLLIPPFSEKLEPPSLLSSCRIDSLVELQIAVVGVATEEPHVYPSIATTRGCIDDVKVGLFLFLFLLMMVLC